MTKHWVTTVNLTQISTVYKKKENYNNNSCLYIFDVKETRSNTNL